MGTKVLRRDGMLMKCLSVLFSVILVIGLMPSGAWAAGTPLGDGSVQQKHSGLYPYLVLTIGKHFHIGQSWDSPQ